MRKFVFAVVLLLAVVFFIGRIAEVQSIVETLQRGDLRYLLLAFGFQIGALVAISLSYYTIYEILGLRERIGRLFLMSSAANFLNIVAPSGGVSGMAVFIAEARRNGYSAGKTAVAGAIFLLFDYAAFLCVLALGLFVLFRRNDLDLAELSAAGVLLAISLVIVFLMYLGMVSSERLGGVLAWAARLVNRITFPFLKKEYLSEQRAHSFACEAAEGISTFTHTPTLLIWPSVLALTKQAMLLMVFFLNFLAFKVVVSTGTIVAGYSIGYLFLIVSPTPAGLGVVEGMLTLTLRSMYVPIGAAAVVTLGYRCFTFWLPFIFGLISFRWLERSSRISMPT
jgi:glycosyltransferase 2 family protein